MRERVCKNCGGREYKVEGQNMIKCKFCGTLYVDEHASKEEEFLLARANELLRACKFDDAVSEYENILEVQPMSYSAYFGKALAKNKIVLYSNKRGSTKRPRFFGSKICSLKDDSDFKKALELAPSEDAKFYNETARRVEKVKKQYEEKTSTQTYDVFMSCVGNEEDINVTNEVYEKINSQFSVYFFNKSQGNEEEVFQALKTCKVFLLFALAEDGYLEDKNLYDRYLYFISQKQKVKSSFVIVANLKKVNNPKLPKDLLSCKSAIDMSSISFIQDLQFMLKTQIEKNIKQTAKIETVKIESVKPKKKEYVDVENVTPSELGNYKVENLTLTDSAKLKWLFLSIKNGDYNTAKDLIEEELSKDENNSEVLFAQLLVENGLRTQEQFFSSIKNFDNKEKISKILKYASKDFAEFFVDSWEKLLIKLNSEEYFNEFLLYLAGFSTPNREEFVAHAESLAVESLNKELIEKVLKCFGQEEVDRYIKFYFLLAQKSDDPIYYQKILELDTGHFQSNMAMLMQHFKSIDDILNYQNREELEQSLKYFNAKKRGEFVIAIVDRILPVAFFDLTKAENQLDFYLAYITEQTQLLKCCEKIFVAFKDMGFFKLAEKYLSIQISKEPENAKLYWELIKIKAHCKSDNELIISDVKIMQMPEWETLLELSDDAMGEYYANIVSKQNLYKGERKKFEQDMFGRVALQEKLKEFILRNQNILLEMEKQEGNAVKKGVDYYRLQLEPFEKYCESLQTITTFEEFLILNEKIKERLKNLDLNFESSVNVLNLKEKHQGLEKFQESEIKTKDDYEKKVSQIKKQNFLKKYLCIFLEFFPLCFTSLLLLISNFAPKEVYMYFSQDFLVLSLIFSVAIAMLNLALFVIKKSSTKFWKAVFLSLFGVGAINLVLFCSSFYFVPNKIQIYNAKELSVLLTNAKFADFVLKDDIDLANINLKGFDFYGIFDGEGHEILNINTTSGGLFKRNGGFIKNLNLHYKSFF